MKPTLGDLEQIVVLALLQLGDDAYGIAVQQEIAHRTDRSVSLGSVYTTLARLEAKGFVKTRIGEPTPTRGGRRRKLYIVLPAGREAVRETMANLRAMSRGLAPSLKPS